MNTKVGYAPKAPTKVTTSAGTRLNLVKRLPGTSNTFKNQGEDKHEVFINFDNQFLHSGRL